MEPFRANQAWQLSTNARASGRQLEVGVLSRAVGLRPQQGPKRLAAVRGARSSLPGRASSTRLAAQPRPAPLRVACLSSGVVDASLPDSRCRRCRQSVEPANFPLLAARCSPGWGEADARTHRRERSRPLGHGLEAAGSESDGLGPTRTTSRPADCR